MKQLKLGRIIIQNVLFNQRICKWHLGFVCWSSICVWKKPHILCLCFSPHSKSNAVPNPASRRPQWGLQLTRFDSTLHRFRAVGPQKNSMTYWIPGWHNICRSRRPVYSASARGIWVDAARGGKRVGGKRWASPERFIISGYNPSQRMFEP